MRLQVYDDFGTAGYSLTDYHEKWMTPNGRGRLRARRRGRARIFGQGAGGSFGNFTTLTITGQAGRSDIVSALGAARS